MRNDDAKLGAETFKNFCEQFGDSVHARILLEELFRGLFHEEIIFVFGQPQQTGNQVDNSASGRIDDPCEINRSATAEPALNLGAEN